MDEPEILRYGALPLLCLVVYILIDKVVAPLIARERNGSGHGKTGPVNGRHGDSPLAGEYRLARIEQDIHEIRVDIAATRETTNTEVQEIRTSAQVSQAILSRLERRLDQL